MCRPNNVGVDDGSDDYGGSSEEAARPDGRGHDGMQRRADGGQRRLRRGEHDSAQARAGERVEESGPHHQRRADRQPPVGGSVERHDRRGQLRIRFRGAHARFSGHGAGHSHRDRHRRRGGHRRVAEGSDRSGAKADRRRHRQDGREHGGAALRALCRPGLRRAVHPHGRQDWRPGGVCRRRARRRAIARN